jgi:hypothetical protein
MLKPHEVMTSSDYKANYGTYVTEEDYCYLCTNYVHEPTGNVVSVIELMLKEVGKDELDALYRVQRIIEDKIHEARMRPVVDEVVSDDSDTCSGVDTYPDDNHPFG